MERMVSVGMHNMSPEITEHLAALLPAEGSLLDIGCGDGTFLRSLPDKQYALFGIDPVDRSTLPAHIHFCRAMAEALPFADESMDAVIMQCVFSLCQPEKTVKEVHRVLKRGGKLLIADLYARNKTVLTTQSALLGRIEKKEQLAAYWEKDFLLEETHDETAALTQMYVQTIFDAEGDSCLACADLPLLKRAKAGYAIWVWQKPVP